MIEKMMYTVDELLAVIPVSRTRLYEAIQSKEIRSAFLGRRRVFSVAAAREFVARIEGGTLRRRKAVANG
jgi:excisionase family DNA binding protein